MAKAKAVKKKQKNPIWGKIWNEVKFFLLSLFSNDTCIEGRHKKWFFAVPVAVVSCVIAVIPTMCTYFGKSGGEFLSSPLYDYEIGLTNFTTTIKEKGLPFKISDNGELMVDGSDSNNNEEAFKTIYTTTTKSDGTEIKFDYYANVYDTQSVTLKSETTTTGEGESATSVTTTTPTYTAKKAVNFAVYVIGDEKTAAEFATSVVLKSEDPNARLGENVSEYKTNFIVFGKLGFYAAKKPSGTSSNPKSSIYCTYKNAKFSGFSFADLVSQDLDGNAYSKENMTASEYREHIVSSWKQVFSAGWDETRISSGWQYTGICMAINVGVTFLLGLMVFLMTRGKNNPFRIYTFWDAQKIGYFASLCPALLSLLGFIPLLSQLGMFLYMLLFGLRIMWMSTKSLRPYQN